jgi:hypothetical protein
LKFAVGLSWPAAELAALDDVDVDPAVVPDPVVLTVDPEDDFVAVDDLAVVFAVPLPEADIAVAVEFNPAAPVDMPGGAVAAGVGSPEAGTE